MLGCQRRELVIRIGDEYAAEQGSYDEAEQMDRRALDSREKMLGKEHPDTLTSVCNLASVLRYQGKYGEAEPMNRRALDDNEKVLGKEHPSTLKSVSNLASVRRDLCPLVFAVLRSCASVTSFEI